MHTIYLGCLIGGAFFAIVTALLSGFGGGDGAHDAPHGHPDGGDHAHGGFRLDFLRPVVIVSGIAAFGGAGLMLEQLASLHPTITALLAVAGGVAIAALVWLVGVRPMRRAEQSIGYSTSELVGKIGETVSTIPSHGFGEIIVRMGAGITSRAAASADGVPIAAGTRVVIVEMEGGEARVIPFDSPLDVP